MTPVDRLTTVSYMTLTLISQFNRNVYQTNMFDGSPLVRRGCGLTLTFLTFNLVEDAVIYHCAVCTLLRSILKLYFIRLERVMDINRLQK